MIEQKHHGNSLGPVIGLTDTLYFQLRLILRQLGATPRELTAGADLANYFGKIISPFGDGTALTFHNTKTLFRGRKEGIADMWQVPVYEEGEALDRYILAKRQSGIKCLERSFLAPLIDLDAVGGAVEQIDGMLLAGGEDIHPLLYAESNKGSGKQHHTRDIMELAFVHAALLQQKPILAICRSAQLLAVALGAELIQDLPSHLPAWGTRHAARCEMDKSQGHNVAVAQGSTLARGLGLDVRGQADGFIPINVNSYHHQAVLQTSSDIEVEAWDLLDNASSRGIVEGFVAPGHPFVVGVQWHPERPLARSNDEPAMAIFEPELLLPRERPHDRALFENFLTACRRSPKK